MSDLTGRNIKDSYQELVTLSGGVLTDGTGSAITSFNVTASNASTASLAILAINANIASFAGAANTAVSASFATNAANAANALTAVTASFALGNFYAVNWNPSVETLTFTYGDGTTQSVVIDVTGSVTNAATASYILGSGVDGPVALATNATNATSASFASNAANSANSVSASFASNAGASSTAISSSFASNAALATTASFATNAANAASATLATSALNAANADLLDSLNSTAFAILANNNVFTGVTQTFTNIAVNGTASFNYVKTVTGSAVIIGDEFVILNADTPATRYAGLVVFDSGSGSPATASFEWDGETDNWIIMEETGDTAVVLTGPTGSRGSEILPGINRLQKGGGHHQLINSTITDTGALVSVGVGMNVTGSVTSTSFIGNLIGQADTAITASFANSATFADNASTATNATSASFATNAVNAVNAISASKVNTLSAGDDVDYNLVFVIDHLTGTQVVRTDNNNNITFNPLTGVLSASSFVGTVSTASFAITASFAQNSENANTATNATSASFATTAATLQGGVGQFATTGSNTFNGNQTFSGSVTGEVYPIYVISSTASIDMSDANFFTLELISGSNTFLDATNIAPGKTVSLQIIQPSITGSLTYGDMFAFVSQSAYTASAQGNAIDILTFITFDNTKLFTVDVKNFV